MASEFSAKYPLIMNILEAYLRPEVDSYNLLVTIHFVMKDSPSAMAEGLVQEFKRLAIDDNLSKSDLVNEFNAEIPMEYQLMNLGNVRQILSTISEYITYLYENENLRGSSKWDT